MDDHQWESKDPGSTQVPDMSQVSDEEIIEACESHGTQTFNVVPETRAIDRSTEDVQNEFYLSPDGNPSGGTSAGLGFEVHWQNGPINHRVDGKPTGRNGAFIEDLLQCCLSRLEFFQGTRFACEHNQQAVQHIKNAIGILNLRTTERRRRGVEGTYQK